MEMITSAIAWIIMIVFSAMTASNSFIKSSCGIGLLGPFHGNIDR